MGSNRIDLNARATRVDSALRDVSLDVSFRSATPVLDLVNRAVPELAGLLTRACLTSKRIDQHGWTLAVSLKSGQ